MLVTHLPPAEVLKLTPDQSGVILEEYTAMNSTGEEEVKPVDLNSMTGPGSNSAALTPQSGANTDDDLGARVKAEMKASLAAKH
jgi:hypothetical protein